MLKIETGQQILPTLYQLTMTASGLVFMTFLWLGGIKTFETGPKAHDSQCRNLDKFWNSVEMIVCCKWRYSSANNQKLHSCKVELRPLLKILYKITTYAPGKIRTWNFDKHSKRVALNFTPSFKQGDDNSITATVDPGWTAKSLFEAPNILLKISCHTSRWHHCLSICWTPTVLALANVIKQAIKSSLVSINVQKVSRRRHINYSTIIKHLKTMFLWKMATSAPASRSSS